MYYYIAQVSLLFIFLDLAEAGECYSCSNYDMNTLLSDDAKALLTSYYGTVQFPSASENCTDDKVKTSTGLTYECNGVCTVAYGYGWNQDHVFRSCNNLLTECEVEKHLSREVQASYKCCKGDLCNGDLLTEDDILCYDCANEDTTLWTEDVKQDHIKGTGYDLFPKKDDRCENPGKNDTDLMKPCAGVCITFSGKKYGDDFLWRSCYPSGDSCDSPSPEYPHEIVTGYCCEGQNCNDMLFDTVDSGGCSTQYTVGFLMVVLCALFNINVGRN
jgi:hypothetical protein